jgi:2-succinyl-5-enolpyruvyl-6-hydroxy-3-cyclohexene-1-carboxylate synthase
MYAFEYSIAHSLESLADGLKVFFEVGKSPKLLEVFTPSTVNDEVLLNYFKFIK